MPLYDCQSKVLFEWPNTQPKDCPYATGPNSTFYEGRCRPWYTSTFKQPGQVIFNNPYYGSDGLTIFFTIGTALIDFGSSEVAGVIAIDIDTKSIVKIFSSSSVNEKLGIQDQFLFTKQEGGPVIVGLNQVTAINNSLPDVADYIFGDDSSGKQAFIESVLPQLFNASQKIIDFEQNGIKKQLMLTPITLIDTIAQKPVHTLQYGVIFEKRIAGWHITRS